MEISQGNTMENSGKQNPQMGFKSPPEHMVPIHVNSKCLNINHLRHKHFYVTNVIRIIVLTFATHRSHGRHNDENECSGATEQLWNAFHNCSVAPQYPTCSKSHTTNAPPNWRSIHLKAPKTSKNACSRASPSRWSAILRECFRLSRFASPSQNIRHNRTSKALCDLSPGAS